MEFLNSPLISLITFLFAPLLASLWLGRVHDLIASTAGEANGLNDFTFEHDARDNCALHLLQRFVMQPDKDDLRFHKFILMPFFWKTNILYRHFFSIVHDNTPIALILKKIAPKNLIEFDEQRHFCFGGAIKALDFHAVNAKNSLDNGNYFEGFKQLAMALHFIGDLSQPYHTNFTSIYSQIRRHHKYERFADKHLEKLSDAAIKGAEKPHRVSNVEESAKSLAIHSFKSFKTINSLVSNAKRNEEEILEETKKLVEKSASFGSGLVKHIIA